MARSVRLGLALTLLAMLTLGAAATATASRPKLFDSSMAGLTTPGQVVDGVTAAGAPWSIQEGRATLYANGRLHVEVQGLIVIALGRNPATTGKAVVSCNGVVAATTDAVPFSTTGDAEVDTTVSLPSPCFGPSVFFTSTGGSWFAATGF
jgi:hypothetical protein